jgi:hypothetical protein
VTFLLAIAWAVKLALAVVLVGVLVRGRARQCWSFVAYLLIVLGCGTLIAAWPSRFLTPEFWLIKQALYDSAKLVVALELAWRVVRAFPGAKRTAQGWALALLPVAVALAMGLPVTAGFDAVAEWQPRMVVGAVSLFSLTALLTLWFVLPVRPWHRALLMGFSAYLLAFTVLFGLLRLQGWDAVAWVNVADGVAYLGLSAWWAVEAWRPEPALDEIPLTVRRRLGLVEAEG